MVVETWHTPPPTPSTNCPPEIIFAGRKPFACVLAPTISLNEKVQPAPRISPLILEQASEMLEERA